MMMQIYRIPAVTRFQAKAHLLNLMTTVSQSSVTENTRRNEQPAVQETDNAKSSIFSKFSLPRTVLDEPEDNEYCMSATEHEMKPEAYGAVNGSRYPRLTKLARISVSASSGSVERLFSVSGGNFESTKTPLADCPDSEESATSHGKRQIGLALVNFKRQQRTAFYGLSEN